MRSANFEFVLREKKAKNRILNDFTLSSCKLRLIPTFMSQFDQFPYGEDNNFTFMLENNSAKRKAISHCYNFLLVFLMFIAKMIVNKNAEKLLFIKTTLSLYRRIHACSRFSC